MDLKLHYVLLTGLTSEAIHTVFSWVLLVSLSAPCEPPSSPRVSLPGCWDFPFPSLSTHSGWWTATDNWLIMAGVEHRATLSTWIRRRQAVLRAGGVSLYHFGVKHMHTQGCDANYTFREGLQLGQCGDLGCTGYWTLLRWGISDRAAART